MKASGAEALEDERLSVDYTNDFDAIYGSIKLANLLVAEDSIPCTFGWSQLFLF